MVWFLKSRFINEASECERTTAFIPNSCIGIKVFVETDSVLGENYPP
jgi:hypothetical protein